MSITTTTPAGFILGEPLTERADEGSMRRDVFSVDMANEDSISIWLSQFLKEPGCDPKVILTVFEHFNGEAGMCALSASQARELAAKLFEAADAIDAGWGTSV
jgi:hypothetical protein